MGSLQISEMDFSVPVCNNLLWQKQISHHLVRSAFCIDFSYVFSSMVSTGHHEKYNMKIQILLKINFHDFLLLVMEGTAHNNSLK